MDGWFLLDDIGFDRTDQSTSETKIIVKPLATQSKTSRFFMAVFPVFMVIQLAYFYEEIRLSHRSFTKIALRNRFHGLKFDP